MTSRGPQGAPTTPSGEPPHPGGVRTSDGLGGGAFAKRSEDWLVDLFGQHSGAVHAYARRRLDSAEDAEDVVVEVFTTAWRRRADVPPEALPWLYATARNVIAHVLRSDARRTRLGTRLATVSSLHTAPIDPGTAVVDAVAAGGVVQAALEDLAEADAELLRLWAWEQLEPAEIAAVLGFSPGTARTRLHRARARLRTALAYRGVADADLGQDTDAREPQGTSTSAAPQTPTHSRAPAPDASAPSPNTPDSSGNEEALS